MLRCLQIYFLGTFLLSVVIAWMVLYFQCVSGKAFCRAQAGGKGGLLFPSQQVPQPLLMILVMLHFLSTVPQSMKESLTGQCLTVPDCQGASDYYNFQSKGLGVLYVYLLNLKTKNKNQQKMFSFSLHMLENLISSPAAV